MLKRESTAWRFILPVFALQMIATLIFFEVFLKHNIHFATQLGLNGDSLFIIGALVFNVVILAVVFFQLRNTIWKPFGGDPQMVMGLVNDIVNGNLDSGTLTAPPETMLANILAMRSTLKSHIQLLEDNAEKLTLAASVFDHAQDGIFITDTEFNIVDVNRSFTKITGYHKEPVLHHKPADLGFGFQDHHYFEKAFRALKNKRSFRGEVWNLHADGNVYASWLDIFSVTNADEAITHYVGIFSDITEVKVQQKNLEHMAYHDPLTQLPNRAMFSDRLNHALKSAAEDEMLAICYFDLDGFKPVNDELGHEAGDMLLVELAKRIQAVMKEGDTIARLGGDEFAMLLNVNSKDECVTALDKLLEIIKQPYTIDNMSVDKVGASIGYTIYPDDLSEPDTLIRHADHAMYYVKVHGRGFHHQFNSQVTDTDAAYVQKKNEIKLALPNQEFVLYYQPKVNMYTGKVAGAEALIRWQHPEKGLIPPVEFIPIIEEEVSLTIALGEWVIDTSLQQIHEWQEKGLSVKVSVNISPKHMMQANFAERISAILSKHPSVSAELLELEITETAVIEDIDLIANTIQSCREMGISFALDDFGVGYSSLTYLRRLPVEVIKVDQSFVRDMLQDSDDMALVSSVISLGNSFGLDVVAEGVESAEHGVELMGLGCQYAQGYGISKPIEADAFYRWANAYQPDARWQQYKKVSNL